MKMHKNISSDSVRRELASVTRLQLFGNPAATHGAETHACRLKRTASVIMVFGVLAGCTTPPPWVNASNSASKQAGVDADAAVNKPIPMLPAGPRPPTAAQAAGTGEPGSMRAGVAAAPSPGATLPKVASPTVPPVALSGAPEAPVARIYQGTGNFVKQAPPAPPVGCSGPS